MTNSDDRFSRLENQTIDLRVAVSAMLETIVLHQRNFETIQGNFETMQRNFERVSLEIRELREDMLQIQAESRQIQSEIRGLQTENRRILERLEQQDDQNEPNE